MFYDSSQVAWFVSIFTRIIVILKSIHTKPKQIIHLNIHHGLRCLEVIIALKRIFSSPFVYLSVYIHRHTPRRTLFYNMYKFHTFFRLGNVFFYSSLEDFQDLQVFSYYISTNSVESFLCESITERHTHI